MKGVILFMNNNFLRLEYDKILDILEPYCKTFVGKEIVRNLLPSFEYAQVELALNETSQAVLLYEKNGSLPIYEIKDISLWLKKLASNQVLTADALLELNSVLRTARALKEYFASVNKSDFPLLEYYFSALYSNLHIEKTIANSIINENTIADMASKKLYSIRKSKAETSLKIKDTLNHFVHSQTYSKYLMDSVVTMKNNRYVIPVKMEYKNQIKGFTHDISKAGSTAFIEPLQVFELNNTLNTLILEENIEIENILKNLSSLFRDYTVQLRSNVEIIGKLDFIFAKATYSVKTNSSAPILNNEKYINLVHARHPLLNKDLVVPIDIYVGKDFRSLIITGPNTGGKTVSLKTVGLLLLMAYSGLHIPAKETSSIFVFDNIFADIGDEQSIQESLSTFSSHIVNIVSIFNSATDNSLILLDELGAGTDPVEGENLALSILEAFYKMDAVTISTSHFTKIKHYALVTAGFKNASTEFDLDTLKPTYKLLIGIPGKSNAFAISSKLGLSKDIIENAISLQSDDSIHVEDLLKKIHDTKSEIEREKENIQKNSNQIESLRKSLEKEKSDLDIKKAEIIEKAKLDARSSILKAKEQANYIISSINSIADKATLKEVNKLRNDLNDNLAEISNIPSLKQDFEKINPVDIKENMMVFVNSLNQNGVVLSLPDKTNKVLVEIGNLKMYIKVDDLCKSSVNTSFAKKRNDMGSQRQINLNFKAKKINPELKILGLTVDEALPIIDKYLDDCYISKLEYAKIVHGVGTGNLRKGIHSYLKKHPHVKSFRVGTFGEGEMGVTIVEIK